MKRYKAIRAPHCTNIAVDNVELQEHPQGKYCLYEDVPQWVSVEERLPEYNKFVLVSFGGDVTLGELTNSNVWFIATKVLGWIYTNDISEWQPLPQPPEDSDEIT